jgi:hypothetical protein
MFLYLNIKCNFTCVRTESYNLHGGTGTSLYTPSLEYIFHKYAPPPKECWYYKTLEFQAVGGNEYKIIHHCKKSVELFLLMYSNRHYFIWSLLNCWLNNCQIYNTVAVMCQRTFYVYCTHISFDTLLHLWACWLAASDDTENILFQSFHFFVVLK